MDTNFFVESILQTSKKEKGPVIYFFIHVMKHHFHSCQAYYHPQKYKLIFTEQSNKI